MTNHSNSIIVTEKVAIRSESCLDTPDGRIVTTHEISLQLYFVANKFSNDLYIKDFNMDLMVKISNAEGCAPQQILKSIPPILVAHLFQIGRENINVDFVISLPFPIFQQLHECLAQDKVIYRYTADTRPLIK